MVVLGTEPRGSAYPVGNPLPEVLDDVEVPALAEQAEGECIVEVSKLQIRHRVVVLTFS